MSWSRFNFPLEITSDKTIMATRMAIGTLISFVITNYYEFVDPTWVYISLFVVLFEHNTVGSSLIRGYMRAIATISSAILSLIIIILFHNYYLTNLLGFIAGTFLYTYLFLGTKESYIGVLGSLTLAICLINYNDLSHVFIRPTNVVIGIMIALFTLRFFFPERATRLLILEIDRFLSEYDAISTYLANTEQEILVTELSNRLAKFEAQVIARVPNFQTLLSEAKVEVKRGSEFPKVVAAMLLSLRHIFRYYASIMASIIYDKVEMTEEDKKNLIFLHLAMKHLKRNLSHLKSKHKLVINPDFICHDNKIISLMSHLISIECQNLEIKINELIDTLHTVKLE